MGKTTKRSYKTDILDSIYHASGNAIFVVDVTQDGDFVFRDLNPTHERLTGLTAEWIRGRRIDDLVPTVPPEAAQVIRTNYRRCLEANEPITYQEVIPINGRDTWWQTTLSPVYDDHGEIVRIVGNAVPIDNLKAAEFALEKAKVELTSELEIEQLRRKLVIEASNTGIWEWNLVDESIYFSDRWKSMLGYAPEELEDSFQTWIDLMHSDDREPSQQIVQRFIEGGEDVLNFEFRLRSRDGTYRWVRSIGMADRNPDGSAARIIGSHQDITHELEARRELELRFRQFLTILESFPGVVYVSDPATNRLLYVNSQTSAMFGRDITDEICYEALQQRDGGSTREPYTWEYHNPVLDRHFLITDRMIDWFDGREVRLEFALDITDRRRMEDQLRQSNRDLQNFAYVASHDLQEPLRKIRAFGDRLRRSSVGQLNDRAEDSLGRMLNAAERMQNQIDAVLTFSRVHTRAGTMEDVPLTDSVRNAVATLDVQIEESGAKVEIGRLPTVRADGNQMEQLFQNLIGNAIKYRHRERSPIVSITSETGDGEVRVIVADNGIGIEPEYRDTVFGMFRRLHSREEYDGTGVGLAICRRIAERHRATIVIEANEPVGTRFVVRFQPPTVGETE